MVDDGLGRLAFDLCGSMTDSRPQGLSAPLESCGGIGSGLDRLFRGEVGLLLYEGAAK